MTLFITHLNGGILVFTTSPPPLSTGESGIFGTAWASIEHADPEERLRLMRQLVQELVTRLYYKTAGYLYGSEALKQPFRYEHPEVELGAARSGEGCS